ncbi:Ankyrin repeat and Glycoside hydrolase, catalytic domain and Beta-hexosaminidase, bacteial type, N-terminal domain and Ankyrin repeat-containing domain-containing protein [Strongyloides ratti]|uniref:Ankyrin repeat and Glycoside hydrolase, catalytic domain and Beta-hexosaminidase, bacteial type, N-terminal domain and Ankyrin repeat-containing domain-containing protein n=1 Tax=Strongyloides ratti TaxID=34506 RepID=A0A090L7X8_STRRB|nr:Ankyrin repeat and Glycoside hydrolase, catalytic domain and Beta-hexosaminidase, bacteial type, N-terminal domain and Ankyrin repeat-containing domain-containing protein [Strongyloides ratti]CEF64188.1 Ankyrin repeat and Glycoside hydrolase, catalytic domain and Beta-hexosaminidase, bacteial type, N-terminal domain and Ankyrin repeat-containing domain-containing protein [Strongyloides ratti]
MSSSNFQNESIEKASEMLLTCINEGRIDVLKSILNQLVKQQNYLSILDGIHNEIGSLLHNAVVLNNVDAVRTLLSVGASPCIQNDENKTPYQCAENEDIKNAFIQEILQAAATSNAGKVCRLIASGVPVNSYDSDLTRNTPLHWAASFGNEEIIKAFCDSQANVNATNNKGETPLHDAVKRNDDKIVRILIDYGADVHIKDNNNISPFDLATTKNYSSIVSLMSMNDVAQQLRRTESIVSADLETASIITSDIGTDFMDKANNNQVNNKLEAWTDLLWPQPQFLEIDKSASTIQFPKDNRLKVYFLSTSEGNPRRLMQCIQTVSSVLSSINLEIEYRGHEVPDSPLEGRVICGLYDLGKGSGSYSLSITKSGIEVYASEYSGIKYGFSTLAQILRLHRGNAYMFSQKNHSIDYSDERQLSNKGVSFTNTSFIPQSDSNLSVNNSYNSGNSDNNYTFAIPAGQIPCLTIRDYPDMEIRAVFQDFSGCRILNTETVLQMATRLSYCKVNYLFVNFESRTTDTYQLPYTNRDLFHMTQVCEELFITLIPSLDFQTNYIEIEDARGFIENFMNDFPLCKSVHFGENITSILLSNPQLMNTIQKRIKKIFLTIELTENNIHQINNLPPYTILCLDARYPFELESKLSARVNVILRHTVSDVGFLTSSPETIGKKIILAEKLAYKTYILGNIICDLSTGVEIMPPSLSYIPEIATTGISWNKNIDFRKFLFFMPRITAEHILLDGGLTVLFEQSMTLGKVEHEITKFSLGQHKLSSTNYNSPKQPKNVISIFVEILLNPDNIKLDRLTPLVFKKARIELRKSMKALNDARKHLPYNFELALVLAEIQLITELMTLLSRLGQSLCMYGNSESLRGNTYLSVGQLPANIRTDMANALLDIRTRFQHTWLSRNMASTLPNALKIFDNLFKALLPPSLQNYSNMVL